MKKCAAAAAAGCLSILFVFMTGCETKGRARFQAEQAYVAGQEQALEQSRPKPAVVTVNGPVRNSTIAWTEELTLAKAVLEADYTGYLRPRFFRVTRNGETQEIKSSALLAGQDMALEAGDVIEVVP